MNRGEVIKRSINVTDLQKKNDGLLRYDLNFSCFKVKFLYKKC